MITVYLITNMATGKVYIGQTCQDYRTRFSNHMSYAFHGRGCRRLRASILRHGKGMFTIQPLLSTESEDHANIAEAAFITLFGSLNPDLGYNLSPGGKTLRGFRWSPESRLKLSTSTRGNQRRLGSIPSSAQREKTRKALLGHVVSEETRRKISESLLRRSL